MRQAPFQRPHFQALADMIRELPDDTCRLLDMRTNRPVDLRLVVAREFAKTLVKTHAHFKADRFMQACGLQ